MKPKHCRAATFAAVVIVAAATGPVAVAQSTDADARERRIQEMLASERPIAVGDDTTDEDLFSAAQNIGGIGIKVGEGSTCANERLSSPADVRQWLKAGAST